MPSNPKPAIDSKAEQILRGAMPEFLKHGYSCTSMDRVAKSAGVSKQTLYSHFSDKDGLFRALIERVATQKYCLVWAKPLSGDPEPVLRDLAARVLMGGAYDEEYLGFLRVIVAESGNRPDLAQLFLTHIAKPAVETLTAYLESRAELALADPEVTARIFVGSLIHFVLVQEVMHGKTVMPMDPDRLIGGLVRSVLDCQRRN